MGLLDDIVAQQSGGGLVGGLPASWQYTNPESLTPIQKQMMALVGTQNPDQAGFVPQPANTAPFPTDGAAPVAGLNSPIGASDPTVPQIPAFGSGATPTLFANAPGSTPGNPALPPPAPAPAAAQDDEDAPAAAAPAANTPASPIRVGNVQVPRIGNAAAFTPDPAALPANATPTQGQGLPTGAPGLPAAPFDAAGDHLKAAWQSMRHGGGLIGGLAGLITGQRDDPANDVEQKTQATQRQQFQAYVAAGFTPSQAMLAVLNPKAAETLIPQVLTKPTHTQETDKDGNVWDVDLATGKRTVALQPKDDKFTNVTVKNPDGSESIRSFNAKTGEYGAPINATANARGSVDPDLTGPARLDAIAKVDPNRARRIQAMVNGDVPLPTAGQAARSPGAKQDIEDVLAVDGSTSASDFATRAATRKDYASGMASRVTKSLNTTIEHAGRLDAAIDRLNNHTYVPGITNWIHDKVGSNFDPEYQKAKSDFESAKEAFVKELDFTLSGGHSSVSGSAELRDKINRADSPEALHAAIQTDLHLLAARLDSHTKGFNEGTKSQRDGQDFLYPKNRAVFNRLMGSQDTSTGATTPGVDSTPAPAAAPTGLPAGWSVQVH